jgi:hypothetical protein
MPIGFNDYNDEKIAEAFLGIAGHAVIHVICIGIH